jgi:ABC-2 type transport system ATP-binding protein
MNDTLAIAVRGLKKAYGSVWALRGVELEVARGELFGFLGPNGAGKTTTIRCMLALIRPQEGSIHVLGVDPQAEPTTVRARVGYLPGELNLEPNLCVGHMLRYLAALRANRIGWSFVQQLADRLQLGMDTRIKNLSRGNKQKVGVIQALMARPELLLLDEPTLGLDPLMQQEGTRLIHEAQEDGTTVFFSSHVISEVEALASHVAIIRHGRIVETVEPRQLLSMTTRWVQVRFVEPVDASRLAELSGVSLLSQDDGLSVTLQVEGSMDGLKALAPLPVADLQTERPSLEELFLTYYRDEEAAFPEEMLGFFEGIAELTPGRRNGVELGRVPKALPTLVGGIGAFRFAGAAA